MGWLHLEVDVRVDDDVEDDAVALAEAFHVGIPREWQVADLTIWDGNDEHPVQRMKEMIANAIEILEGSAR